MTDFYRVRRLPPYVFEQVNRLKAQARSRGADIIDLGMGNPDLPAPKHVIEKLVETAGKPRTDRYSASKGIAGPAPRAGRLLRAPLRREAQSGHAGHRHAGLEGRLRQHGAGDHRARRRGARAQPVLSDPRLRLPDGGRRHPLRARPSRRRSFSARSSAPSCTRSPSRSRWSSAIPSNPTADGRDPRFLQGPRRLREEARDLHPARTSPMPRSISTSNPPPSVLQVPGAKDVTVEFTSMSKTYLHGRLAHGLRGRQRAAARRARAREVLSRLRRLHADPGGRGRRAQRPRRLHRARCARSTRSAAT